LTFDKCLYLRGRLRLTAARQLLAYMSSRALATTTASSSFLLTTHINGTNLNFLNCSSVLSRRVYLVDKLLWNILKYGKSI